MFIANVYGINYTYSSSLAEERELQEQLKKIAISADLPFFQKRDQQGQGMLFFQRKEDASKVIYKYNGSYRPVTKAVLVVSKTIMLVGEVVEEAQTETEE